MKHTFTLFTALLLVAFTSLRGADVSGGALAPALQPFVDRQVIGGIVALVADKDRVLDITTVGYSSIKAKSPMRADSMFWIASITKTFTATSLMLLVDEGKVNVDDAVEKYLPEFKGQQVTDAKDKTKTHPPQHPITIKELLTHTSGIIGPNDPPIKRNNVLKDDAEQYGRAPLQWEPGTKYQYNNSGINTAGRIIEVVSGMPYGDFVKQRLLDPLGMTDTTFWPDEKQAARLAMTSQFNTETSALEDLPNKADDGWLHQSPDVPHVPVPIRAYLGDALRAYPNHYAWPAGGLFSSAPDLVKFGQMMLNRGVRHGKRLVSEAAFKRMTTPTPMPESMRPKPSIGLGWFVKLNDNDGPAIGSFGHNGARGPEIWIDPKHQLVMILMIESMDINTRGDSQKQLRTACFKAAVEKYGKQ